MNDGVLVEAAGVQPASENVTGQEDYMLFDIYPVSAETAACRTLH